MATEDSDEVTVAMVAGVFHTRGNDVAIVALSDANCARAKGSPLALRLTTEGGIAADIAATMGLRALVVRPRTLSLTHAIVDQSLSTGA